MTQVLSMSKNVFGSVFQEKKVSRSAKRVIESELIIPTSAIEMSYDEMEYVDGGWSYYASNSELWSWLSAAAGGISVVSRALYGSGTTIFSIIGGAVSKFKAIAAIGAIPVWGWIALGVVTGIVLGAASLIATALIQGKGIYLYANASFNWFKTKISAGISIR